MANRYGVPFWKKAPFVRFLSGLIAGIILQWEYSFPVSILMQIAIVTLILFTAFSFLPLFARFRHGWINGCFVFLIMSLLGGCLTHYKDIRNNKAWLGHYYNSGDTLTVTLQEPLVEKTNSYKAIASVNNFSGNIILYLKKDSAVASLTYGSQIAFHQSLQLIKNAGNPGGFDYKTYCLMQGISHQVYLKPTDLTILPEKREKCLDKFLFSIGEWTTSTILRYIKGEKERGLAEALLIGYKNDLDKTLVQSYTNTGLAHVIAISGLHIALIYWLLIKLLQPLENFKRLRWLHPVAVIGGLWLFSLLAGAQPSILRAALMFTIIILGKLISRRATMLNSLAASAFILLCFDPFMLWDVGFQLSYAALLSLILFAKPVYNWFYFENKTLIFFWLLISTTIAAQVLTTPISIFHFHQFPLSFLLSNFLAVPLSSLIVLVEIALCLLSFIEPLATVIGQLAELLIYIMNTWVERIEMLPFALWDGLLVTITQVVCLYFFIVGIGYWLMEWIKTGLWVALSACIVFAILRIYSFRNAAQQQKLIVYNVSKHSAIDIVEGRKYFFIGDSALLQEGFLQNFNLKPSRILHRISPASKISSVARDGNIIHWHDKRIWLVDSPISEEQIQDTSAIDLLILSKKASLSIKELLQQAKVKMLVFDASLPFYKVKRWIAECDSLRLPYHNVETQGAYIINN